jgi:hypothetical protein
MNRKHATIASVFALVVCCWSGGGTGDVPNSILGEDGIPLGWIIIEGDIQVPGDWFQSNATVEDNLWTNGIVPFQFDGNVSTRNQQSAIDAMAEWSAVANITFIPRTSELTFIHFRDSDGNNSPVGMGFGQRTINIDDWDSRFVICHEIAHSLGFWHEQSRADRDAFIQINFENVCQNCCGGGSCTHNFNIQNSSTHYGPYDFDSVMHYSFCQFSTCLPMCPPGCETITVLPPNEDMQGVIGQRDHLSVMDAMTMSFMYPEPGWRFLALDCDIFDVQGTFLDPYCLFDEAYEGTPEGGTLWIQPGFHSTLGVVMDKPMTLRAPLGGVTLHAQ